MSFANCESEDETIGQWFRHVRNAIEHPNSNGDETKEKYLKVARDPFQIQRAYAYLSGLYLKAILLSLGNINEEHIDKYTRKYIRSRASFEPTEYD
ncbi:MAG: hypothetical protein OXH90_02880 [Paracoccaceae bacterium]|nr:hypothetical protein [Paracoccaceae bacterium]MDE2916530.1 hypothetical protein [Paracoccaceae bacterium]